MLNLKLRTICSFIKEDDVVLDMGCDHAYLAIYLKEKRLCQEVMASDISEAALKGAKKNIEDKKLDIKTFLADGFRGITCDKIDTVVIAGVGTNTVLDIVKDAPLNVKKIIISSNNKHFLLRLKMQDFGFYLEHEEVIKEKKKFYPIMVFERNSKVWNEWELKYGISQNKDYFEYILDKEKSIYKKIPKKNIRERSLCLENIRFLKKKIADFNTSLDG